MWYIPRAFDPNAAREAGGEVQREARRMDGSIIYVLDGRQRFRAGYLQRQVGMQRGIQISGPNPDSSSVCVCEDQGAGCLRKRGRKTNRRCPQDGCRKSLCVRREA